MTWKQSAEKFVELVLQGIEVWMQAGEIAAKAVEADPEFVDRVCEICPDINEETVNRFVLMGLKKLHPQLCLSETPGVRRLRRLPYSLQEKHVKDPVDLVVKNDDGKVEILKVDVRNLTVDQSAQVFSVEGVRSHAEQRAWIEDKATKRVVPPVNGDLPYRITGRELVILNPCRLPRRDVARILADMEA